MLPDAHRRQDELDRFRTLLVTSVNAGCSLQALMALLGRVSAEMSLRYGRLFDATVREEYTRALSLAKARLGPVLPGERTQLPLAAVTSGNWRDAPPPKAPALTPTSASIARTSAPRPASCPCCNCSGSTPKPSPPTPNSVAGARRPPGTAASSSASTCSSPRPMPADHDEQARVEVACAELAAAGQSITFAHVAARAGISRTTLYRRADLRAVIDEHRTHGRDATTLTGRAHV